MTYLCVVPLTNFKPVIGGLVGLSVGTTRFVVLTPSCVGDILVFACEIKVIIKGTAIRL